MNKRLTVALVAHDNMKHDLAEWVAWNWEKLLSHRLVCTGTTGRIVAETLMERRSKDAANSRFDITMLKSGPLGGDQQLGAMIANGDIDMLIFFWDPMSAQPHDVDVKALLRVATLYNVPTATNAYRLHAAELSYMRGFHLFCTRELLIFVIIKTPYDE